MKRFLTILVASLALTACAHPAGVARPAGPLAAQGAVAITPEDAQAKAAKKATGWNADARLVAVGWVVAKYELTSVVYHLFQSPKADQLYMVQTKLTSFWQDGHAIVDPRYCKPARYLDTLGTYRVTAHDALAKAKAYLPASDTHPVSFLIEAKPTSIAPALWAVKADAAKALIDAETGEVLIHDAPELPDLPF